MSHGRRIRAFVENLSAYRRDGLFNPWGEWCREYDADRDAYRERANRLYSHLLLSEPILCMVGEACGYQGARYSGIPFTSERILLEYGVPRVGVSRRRITTRRIPFSEPSATIVWGALRQYGAASGVVLFNACSFHPFADDVLSNRAPTKDEITESLQFLQALRGLYPNAPFVPIGQKAAAAFTQLEWASDVVLRHPANGGAPAFRAGLRAYLAGMGALAESPRLF